MERKLFILAAAALTLTACSNDETTAVKPENSISFRTAVDSRATEVSSLETFYVSALNGEVLYMDNVEFAENNGVFESTAESYNWPKEGSLDFYAFAPSIEDLGKLAVNKDGKKITGFSPNAKIGEQVDFVSAVLTNASEPNEGNSVELTFGHKLSQIEIKAKNESAYTYKVAGVKIARVASKGDFDFTATNPWTPSTTETAEYVNWYNEPKTLSATAQVITAATIGNAMLIPQQLTAWEQSGDTDNEGSYIAVLVNIKDANGKQIYPVASATEEGKDTYNWVAVGIGQNWQPGKKYTYTLDFTTGGGLVAPGHGGSVTIPSDNPDDDDPDVDPTDPENLDDDDDLEPGNNIVGSVIKFTATVSAWTNGFATDDEEDADQKLEM